MTTMITKRMLRGACKEQRAIFLKEWPEGAEATIENVQMAVELGLDLSWGTRWFTWKALDEYERQRAPFYKEYERQKAPIREAYERQIAPIREAYERQFNPFYKDYQRRIAPFWFEAFIASLESKAI